MDNVASYAAEVARRAKNGAKPVIRVKKEYAESFFGELKREGFEFVKECLERISDPDLRRIIEAIFYSTVAGAAAGALIGTAVGGAPGAKVGAAVGAGVGFVAACVAVAVTARQEDGPEGTSLVVGVQ